MRILTLLLLCISWYGKNQVDAAGALRQVSSGGVVYAAAPLERGAYAVGGKNGQSHYGYNTGTGIAKVEVRQPNGSVVGSYRYFDPNGKQVVRSYIADSNGFRVLGNDLPISLDTPASQVLGAPALTGAFEGTTDFDIPPPLFSDAQQNVLQESRPSSLVSQSSALQQHQQAYQRQLQQLENQREELRAQQEKLEALQREVEAQQQKIQQYQSAPTQTYHQQQISSPSLTSSLRDHHPYYQRSNTLTGGLTSPYYYFDQHLNYDFPAGFAYPGLPVAKSFPAPKPQPIRKGCYPGSNEPGCGHNYIIGRARK